MRFERFLRVAALLAWGLCGCMLTPPADVARTFVFPFVNDYGIENRVVFDWDDAYLAADSGTYRQCLAGPLSALAASTYGYRLRMDVASLKALGFEEARMERHYGRQLDYAHPLWGRDQSGYTLAAKKAFVGGCMRDIVFVLVRGTFGRTEWLSNLNVCNAWGRTGEGEMPYLHEGFSRSAEALEAALEAYVARHNIHLPTAKVVIAGHSRGAAVANLLGASLDKPLPGSRFGALERRNVFVYTFAAPNVILRADIPHHARVYENIFNIINPEDTVPHVPLAQWEAKRYGRDLFLRSFDHLPLTGSWTYAPYTRMKKTFKDMTGYVYWHTPLGTNSTQLVPAILGAAAPRAADLYFLTPQQLKDGNHTSVHSFLEMLIYRAMDDAQTLEEHISLGGDVKRLSQTYASVQAEASEPFFYMPDGRDFSRQPGILDLSWRMVCMHAPQTYISWMKAASLYGPRAVFVDFPEEAPCQSR